MHAAVFSGQGKIGGEKVKLNLDTIQFESRCEIDEVINALETFLEEHPDSESKKTVKELDALLDAMYISW